MGKRYIKLYEQITKWEWFHKPATLCLFVYLLLKANYKDLKFEGMKVRRGQLVTSLPKLATDTGLTIQQVRTALSNLQSTGEITDQSTPRYRIITIIKYDDYQSSTDSVTDKQQAANRQITASIEREERIERKDNIEPPKGGRGASRFTPPSREEIQEFCLENGLEIDVDYLFDYYSAKGWKIGKESMKDWKAAVRNWARREKKEYAPKQETKPAPRVLPVQDFVQRSYENEQDEAMDRMMTWGGDV